MQIRNLLFVLMFMTLINAQAQEYIFATYCYANNDRVKNIEPFANHFALTANVKTKVVSYNSVHELLAALQKGEVDFVFINTFGYLLLKEQSDQYEIAAALHVPKGVESTYQSVIVSSVGSGITDFSSLKEKSKTLSLLLVNPGSTSGNLVPRLQLAAIGIPDADSSFDNVAYTKNHALTLQQIVEGQGNVGAFGSEEYYKLLKENPAEAKKVNLLWESAPIPLGPALFKKSLSDSLTKQFTESLLTLHDKNAQALEAIKAGWTEAKPADRFHRINDSYYEPMLNITDRKTALEIIRKFAQ